MVFYVLLIAGIEIAFTKREVIDRIKDICFAGSIGTNKAVNLFRELHISIFVIFEIGKPEILKVHNRFRLMQKYNPMVEFRNLICEVAQTGDNTDIIW